MGVVVVIVMVIMVLVVVIRECVIMRRLGSPFVCIRLSDANFGLDRRSSLLAFPSVLILYERGTSVS